MKLIFLLLLVIVPFHLCSTLYTVLGEIPRQGSTYFHPYRDGINNAFYLDVSNIPNGYGVFFKVSLSSGNFESKTMYIGGKNEIIPVGQKMDSLPTPISYYIYHEKDGNKNCYFVVYKFDNFRYYYVAPPPASGYNIESKITIVNTQGPSYYVLGDIDKFNSNSFTPSTKGLSQLFCIDTNNYPNEIVYYFKSIITNGNFAYGLMYYGGSNTKLSVGTEVTLSYYISYSTHISNSEYTFAIQRIKERYLYVAPPPPYEYYSQSKITVFNIYSLYETQYKVLGGLTKFGSASFDPIVEGKYCAYYIKASDISKDNKFFFEAKLTNGKFEHKHMFYGGSDFLYGYGATIPLPNNVKIDISDTFVIPQTSYTYLYFAPPPIYENNMHSTITVYNTDGSKSKKVAIGVGVGVSAFVVIVVILVIIFYKRRKGSVNSTNIDTSSAEPIHLNATHY